MVKNVRSRNKKSRWALPFFIILLAVAGVILYRWFPSLQDIGRIVQSAVSKIPSAATEVQKPTGPVLRGTIYDRNFNELAVSYRLYTLYANPVEMADRSKAASALASIVNIPAEKLQDRLKSDQYSLELATDLDERQAEAVNALHLAGLVCRETEARFYPAHTAASHVIGFMGDGVGLAGVEGKYDPVLQGVFRQTNIPDIDFQGHERLGDSGADLILTLDINLQKKLEQRFREYLNAVGPERCIGMLIEPGSGRILALMNQPSFNPNYFWKVNESNRINRLYNHVMDKALIRPILARAAAIERKGLDNRDILPVTVAAPSYGFTSQQLNSFEQQIQLYGSVFGNWESGPTVKTQDNQQPVVTGVQVGVTLASLVNGGWRITPYVIDSLYDHTTKTRYLRGKDATQRTHVLDPALSVMIRRELFSDWAGGQDDDVVFNNSDLQILPDGQYSQYSMQHLFVALTPAKHPQYLLLLATEEDHLLPDAPNKEKAPDSLEQLARDVLSSLPKNKDVDAIAGTPPPKSADNQRQFLISKRLNFQDAPERDSEPVAVMPQMRGMSLRKGLQQLGPLNVKVRVNGTGQIVAQYPPAGQPLAGIDECIITLKTR